MVFQNQHEAARRGAVETITALLGSDGSKSHPHASFHLLPRGRDTARDLADAVHFFAKLHGQRPGVIDLARERPAHDEAREWLEAAAEGFAAERAYLLRVVVAVGPLPGTPGQAESEAAVTGQRHAVEMLARSERNGCALGAALALALDWRIVRGVIDAAAQRFGAALIPPALPSQRQTLAVAARAGSPAIERAMVFGTQQLLAQHHGLWDLLEARAGARNGLY